MLHCLYAAFSHFRYFNTTCISGHSTKALRAFRILQDAGVSLHSAGSSLTAVYPLGWPVCLRWDLQISLEFGTDLWLVGLVVSGFTLCKEHLHFCWLLPCLLIPVQGSSVQNPTTLRGFGPFCNISPVLIWVKGVSASHFIKKNDQTFCILPSSWVIP